MYILISLIILTISLFTTSVIIKKSAFYSSLLNSKVSRNGSLDGFRGGLALSVVLYHSNITYFYYQNHQWSGSHSHFLNILGNGAVIFFFIITGFLFWEMVLRKNGVGSIKHFFAQRIKRLMTMFLVSLLFIFLVAFFQSKYTLVEILNNLYNKILFLLHINNSNLSVTGIGNMSIINAGVFWTLIYEWKFYIIFPIVSLFFIHIFKMWRWFPVLAFLVVLIFLQDSIWTLFSLGMMSASIKHQFDIKVNIKLIPFILILMIIGLFFFKEPYNLGWYVLAFSIFTAIFSLKLENFRILDFKPLKLMGVMSYSIYLLHGILLWITFQTIDKILPINSMSFELYWVMIGFIIVPLMLASALTFQHIENRFHHY